MNRFKVALLSLPLLMLAGCVTQDQADAKMVQGCQAGVRALITPKEILNINSKTAKTEFFQQEGQHRFITLNVKEKDGWVEQDVDYTCVFLEQWGFLQMGHQALMVQIKIGDQVYGKDNGVIVGDVEDFMKLTDTVDTAMGQ